MSFGFVYMWTNVVNGKRYIGSHIGDPEDGYTGSGTAFLRALKKYGQQSFVRTLLEQDIPAQVVREREQHFIDHYDAARSPKFYNMRAKVDGGFEYINNHPNIAEIRKRNVEALRKWHRHNTCFNPMKGKHHTAEHRAKLAAARDRKNYKNKRPVYCFSLTGELMDKYPSLSEAAQIVNGNPSNIKYTAEGKYTSAYGKLWSYTEQCPPLPKVTNCKKRVRSPLGVFETISAAAKAHGINALTVKRKIAKPDSGFSWHEV